MTKSEFDRAAASLAVSKLGQLTQHRVPNETKPTARRKTVMAIEKKNQLPKKIVRRDALKTSVAFVAGIAAGTPRLLAQSGSTADGPQTQFEVKVKTGTESGAGTDANIDITLYLADGSNVKARLNPFIDGDAFENGHTDKVVLTVEGNAQEVYRIAIRSDGKYPGAAWLLDNVQVRNLDPRSNTIARFTYRKWISGSETGTALNQLTRDRDDVRDFEKRTGRRVSGLNPGRTRRPKKIVKKKTVKKKKPK